MSEWVANGRQKENRVLEQATEVPFLTSPPPPKKKKKNSEEEDTRHNVFAL